MPIQATPRQGVPFAHVVYLEEPPTRPYEVIGIITPPADAYDTEAAAMKDVRTIAARHGADAIFVESKTETSGWKFSSGMWGSGGGTTGSVAYRVKAIVWK